MARSCDNDAAALGVARVLDDHKGEDTLCLFVGDISSITDYLVIATARSVAHMRGLVNRIGEYLESADRVDTRPRKKPDESGWTLIDCGNVVIHIMTKEKREFYELERLWFEADIVYSSKSSSSNPPESESSSNPSDGSSYSTRSSS